MMYLGISSAAETELAVVPDGSFYLCGTASTGRIVGVVYWRDPQDSLWKESSQSYMYQIASADALTLASLSENTVSIAKRLFALQALTDELSSRLIRIRESGALVTGDYFNDSGEAGQIGTSDYVREDWTTTDGWIAGTGSTVSVEDNSLRISFNGLNTNGAAIYRNITDPLNWNGKRVRIKLRASDTVQTVSYYDGTTPVHMAITTDPDGNTYADAVISTTYPSIIFYVNVGVQSAIDVWVKWIYGGVYTTGHVSGSKKGVHISAEGGLKASKASIHGKIEADEGYFKGIMEAQDGYFSGRIDHSGIKTQEASASGTLTIPSAETNPPYKYWSVDSLRAQITALGGGSYSASGSWMGITPTRIGGSGSMSAIAQRTTYHSWETLDSQTFRIVDAFRLNLYGTVRLRLGVAREPLGSNTVGQLRILLNDAVVTEPTWNTQEGYLYVDITGNGASTVAVYARIYSWGVFHYYAYYKPGDLSISGYQYITNISATDITGYSWALVYSFWSQPSYINIATHYGNLTGAISFTAGAHYYTGADLIAYIIPSTVKRFVEYDCSMSGGLASYTSFILGANYLRFRTVLGSDSGSDLVIWEDSTMYNVTGSITLPEIPARVKVRTLEPMSSSEDIGLTTNNFRDLFLSRHSYIGGNEYVVGTAYVKKLMPYDSGNGCMFKVPLVAPASLENGAIWMA